MTFYTSLAGINAAGFQLATSSNNIANVDTAGFKRARTSFEDVYVSSLQQNKKIQEGQGLSKAELRLDFQQGSLVMSGNVLDLAILGNGFLPLKSASGGKVMFSRDGALQLNPERYVTNAEGDLLQVASQNTSGQTSANLKALQVPQRTQGQFTPTRRLDLANNFTESQKKITVAFQPNDPSTYSQRNNIDFVDESGNVRKGALYFIKASEPNSAISEWKTVLVADGQQVVPQPRTYLKNDVPNKVVNAEFIEWTGQGAATDTIAMRPADKASTELNVLSLVGDRVFRGTGGSAEPVGVLDAEKNGKNGKPLRLNLLSVFANNSFETVDPTGTLKGWTVLDSQVKLDGKSVVAGFATPVDKTNPTRSPGDDVTVSGAFFNGGQDAQGSAGTAGSAKLYSTGSINAGFGVMHGPALVSNEAVPLKAGDEVSFDWKASGGQDAYDVYAYLLNVDTGKTIKLLDQTGLSASEKTEWTNVKTTVPEAGNFKFVFVSGSYDATGGRATGAQLYVDNVKTPPAPKANLALFDPLVSYTRQLVDTEGLVRFDTSGKLAADMDQLSFKSPLGGKADLSINLKGSMRSDNPYAVLATAQDGVAEGVFSDLSIDNTGLVTAKYSNGHSSGLGRILLANFTSAGGLAQAGSSRFTETPESGGAVFGMAGSSGLGKLQSGALEKSNVNLTIELVELITAQRNFQANAKAIETLSAMTKNIVDNIS